MSNETEYNLEYEEISTGRIFKGRKPLSTDYVVLDPMTGEKEVLNRYRFFKRFKSTVRNKESRSGHLRKCKDYLFYQ